MTDREIRNAAWKTRITRDAEEYCRMIDTMEDELKDRERMASELASEIDRRGKEHAA